MELLSELLLTGALSFLISLLLAKFVSSSLTADHLRHGVVTARSPPPTAAAGGKTSSTETSVGLEERMVVRSVSGDETSGFGTVGDKLIQKEHVAGCDGVGEMRPMVSVREENLARVMERGSGFEEEKIVEQSFCSDVFDESGIVLVFEGEKTTTKEIVLDGGVGVTGIEDEETNEIISESDNGVNTGDDEFERELIKAVGFKAMANEYDCKEDAKGVISEDEIGVGGMEDEGQGRALPDECDDWEGIERSDTEKFFVVASEFGNTAGGKEALSQLSDDLQMRLYGLHKIATEGPCYQTQPLTLKLSARARWHSWQKLGNMDPEVAMEQYIDLLSDSFPEWLEGRFRVSLLAYLAIPVKIDAFLQAANAVLKYKLQDESKTEGDYSSGYDKSGLVYPTTSSGQDRHFLETKRNA